MRRLIGTVIGIVLLSVGVSAEYYRLENVKRVDRDLYKTGNVYIETRGCYHYSYGETAIYSDTNNTITWEDGSRCDVRRMFR